MPLLLTSFWVELSYMGLASLQREAGKCSLYLRQSVCAVELRAYCDYGKREEWPTWPQLGVASLSSVALTQGSRMNTLAFLSEMTFSAHGSVCSIRLDSPIMH